MCSLDHINQKTPVTLAGKIYPLIYLKSKRNQPQDFRSFCWYQNEPQLEQPHEEFHGCNRNHNPQEPQEPLPISKEASKPWDNPCWWQPTSGKYGLGKLEKRIYPVGEVGKILRILRAATWLYDPCPSWLIKTAGGGGWLSVPHTF